MTNATRLLVGLSVGSGLEGVDAVVVRAVGPGWNARPVVEKYLRLPFAPDLREQLRSKSVSSPRATGDALALAARRVLSQSGYDCRDAFCVGLFTPARPGFGPAAEIVADQTGLTVLTAFGARDIAAGGAGTPLTPAADFLFHHDSAEDRILIHLGAVASLLFVPASGRMTEMIGFEAGPANRLLDAIARHGSRGKDGFDPGGAKAVQGRCLDELLAEWSRHGFLQRKPPKQLPPGDFDDDFLTRAIDTTRSLNGGWHDLLCTAAHFIARSIGFGARQWLPLSATQRGIYVSGGGVRNGFLWQLLQQQFPGEVVRRSDDLGMPALGRNAAAAAVLALLTLDGVTASLPLLTGASGGRLIGRIVPGDPRNWATVAGWAAEQMWDHVQYTRAA